MSIKKGFTLVELSIVLVVVGLLIGGILAAQSMISTSKIQALTRQVGQLDAAFENFKTKYNQIPGDTNLMGNYLGNNNGFLDDGLGANYSWGGEIAQYWPDLSMSGLLNTNGSAYLDGASNGQHLVPAGPHMPTAVAGNNANFVPYTANGTKTLYYVISTVTGGIGSGIQAINSVPSFAPADALALDQKLDDGLASSGNVVGTDKGFYTIASSSQPSSGTTCTTSIGGNTYQASTSTLTCSMVIRVGTGVGDPQ